MINIDFYKYNGLPNVVNKSLGTPVTVNGVLRDVFNVVTPVLRVSLPNVPYNYCFVPVFGRYYFITGCTVVKTGVYELHLKCDVLKSYADVINVARGTVTETNAEHVTPYLSNRTPVYDIRPKFEQVEFPNKNLLDETGQIIMVTIKGDI